VQVERVGRIVGGADDGDLGHGQEIVHAQLAQLGVGFFPDLGRALAIEQDVDAEIALQLQVGPVIQRIAQRVGHGFRPGLEFLHGLRVAGAKALGHAVRPHRAPLVVVAAQPDLGEIGKAMIRSDQRRREVAVII
jgi:hypothetical protein